MDLREEYARWQRLRAIARQRPVEAAQVAALIQPFIDRHKNLRLTRQEQSGPSPSLHPRHAQIVEAVTEVGVALRRAGVRGLSYHNGLRDAVAALAETFGYRAFVECRAGYDTPEIADHAGRMDVVWATDRRPVVLFEIDSTAKVISLQKLQLHAGAHKYWVFFGSHLWEFKTMLRKRDPEGQVTPIIVPRTFRPGSANERLGG